MIRTYVNKGAAQKIRAILLTGQTTSVEISLILGISTDDANGLIWSLIQRKQVKKDGLMNVKGKRGMQKLRLYKLTPIGVNRYKAVLAKKTLKA